MNIQLFRIECPPPPPTLLPSMISVCCSKYQVHLCSDKTKLLVFHGKDEMDAVDYIKGIYPITINGEQIVFTDLTEHVGLVCSTSGNLPTLFAIITAHIYIYKSLKNQKRNKNAQLNILTNNFLVANKLC